MEKILLSKITNGICKIENDCYITSVVSDSRQVEENSIFLAIIGERVNGEDYAKIALEKGAKLIVSEHDIKDIPKENLCVVESVLDTNILMAKNYREIFDTQVIAVTGRVGKTTTKDFIYCAVSPFKNTVKSLGNNNNELGLPKTVYNFTGKEEMAVLEMGMADFNDVHKLSVATSPICGVITNIGVSHLQTMKTQENILKAKLEICDGISEDGFLVLNKDDKFLKEAKIEKPKNVFYYAIEDETADVTASDIVIDELSTKFILNDGDLKLKVILPTIGNHNVLNALAAYLIATKLGFDKEKVAKSFGNYTPSGMRQNITTKNDIIYIEDCYNASPDSMKASLKSLKAIAKKRSIAVLGDMLELGDDSNKMHCEIGEFANKVGIDFMLCFGEEIKHTAKGFNKDAKHFNTKQELCDYLISILKKDDTVLFKASNGMKFDEIIKIVYENQE